MNALTAYSALTSLGLPVVGTSEAGAVLAQSPVTAAQTLRRLAKSGLIKPLRHGQFWLRREPVDAWVVLDFIAAPYPAYGSLYSALYLHGALSQIPALHFAVTLGRTRRVKTSAGEYSLHQISPSLFGGFESPASGANIADLEKALFDLAYLGGTRARISTGRLSSSSPPGSIAPC